MEHLYSALCGRTYGGKGCLTTWKVTASLSTPSGLSDKSIAHLYFAGLFFFKYALIYLPFPNFKLIVKAETEGTKSPNKISTERVRKSSLRVLDTNPQIQSIRN